MAVETGKRYRCNACGAEFIVTRGGDGALRCGDDELEQI
ncbi:MAG: desulfoferrodoxin [Chloroflexi bacterium]|jgi:DNA-directed RNA polymerase subunit RPC12/RpoP|nr:desulfoferrodoxin [Chloroflexota bacterium]